MNSTRSGTNRPRIIGPATLIALAAVAVIAFYNSGRLTPPKIMPHPVLADFKTPNGPDTERILAAREKLSLNGNQIAELEKTLADWRAQSAPAIAKMRKAYENISEFLNTPPKKPPAMQDLMRRAGPLSDATAEYIKLRSAFQQRAVSILTPDQKALWEKVKKENEVRRNEKQPVSTH